MAQRNSVLWERDERQRTRDQVALVRAANKGQVESDARDPADYTTLFVPEVVLVAAKDRPRLERVLRRRSEDFFPADAESGVVERPITGLVLFRLPRLRRTGERSVRSALDILDQELGKGVVTPDHYVHLSATPGNGRPCPATEPAETGLRRPWPARTRTAAAGDGVKVTVVDTGWWSPAHRHAWLAKGVGGDAEPIGANLHAYSGHGTFIAGVVRCRAPLAEIRHERFQVLTGGAVRESALVRQLRQAIDRHQDDRPHVINLSAGTYTREDQQLKSFQVLWDTRLSSQPNTLLIAAAGNEGLSDPFYPAAFPWAVGVGSLDRGKRISSFSNFGVSADVFVTGRNHVNAYPDGRFVCKETPDRGSVRRFRTGLARWSGTSFAAPLMAGIVAAEVSGNRQNRTTTQIAWTLVSSASSLQDAEHGQYQAITGPYH